VNGIPDDDQPHCSAALYSGTWCSAHTLWHNALCTPAINWK